LFSCQSEVKPPVLIAVDSFAAAFAMFAACRIFSGVLFSRAWIHSQQLFLLGVFAFKLSVE
jgi:hypothetical protein